MGNGIYIMMAKINYHGKIEISEKTSTKINKLKLNVKHIDQMQ